MTDTVRLNAAIADRYRIERELGQGGMATVYLAHDLRHDRRVALKVLKPELAAVLGAERFVVEIKTTAKLQHPHILPLFDSGAADGFLYYVMPFVDGETLRGKLNRETQLGIDEAVRITTQVADALDYAHRHGVIHRDIKPENILLHDGRPIVADFGIALALSAAASGRLTETGLSLGTPHYMSPEQATADKEITGRSDIYSLASVLYEMLTGNPPHTGSSAQQIIMKIIADEAEPVTKHRKTVPANIAAAVAKALERLPADRFESAAAFAAAMANPSFTSATSHGTRVAAATRADWRRRVAVPALALSAVLMVATGWVLLLPPPPAPAASRYVVDLPEGKRIGTTIFSTMVVSPDGSSLVYLAESGRLLVRSRDLLEPSDLAGTEGAFNPFFSPDGQRVGFMNGAPGNAEIKVVSLAGGPPTLVTNTGVGGPGAAWGYDGYIYFDASGIGPLMRVRESGGESEAVSVLDTAKGELQHNWPDPLPNGRGVLMVVDRGGPGVNVAMTNDIAVLDLATHTHRLLVRGVYARYSRSGHLLYVTPTGVLMAAPFDQNRMTITGSPVPLLEGVGIRRGGGGVDLTISATGTLWYGAGATVNQQGVLWASRSGAFSEADSGWFGDFVTMALSPDGTRLALSVVDPTGEQIWVKRLGPKGTLTKLTFEGVNALPQWRADGSELLYISRFQTRNLRSVRADGDGSSPTDLLRGDSRAYSANWSPDGKWLVYETIVGAGRDIAGFRPGVDSAPVLLVKSTFAERKPSISPDGRWLLYEATNSGAFEVYVRPFPNVNAGLYQISTGGGMTAKWSRDGREIFFVNPKLELVRVAVVPGNSFAVADQRVLFSMRGVLDWDVAPDGRRFIVIRDRQGQQRNKLVVVENFFQELRGKVSR